MNLNKKEWKEFILGKLFIIKKGKRLTSAEQEDGENNYIGAIDSNNGVANHIAQSPIHKGNTISLSYNGSVGEAFYQKDPYWATDDVNALYSKYNHFNEAIGLFIVSVLRQEKYKFSYGRKWTLENMNSTIIKLPIKHNADGTIFVDDSKKFSDEGYVPDWQWMEDYIKSLHYKPLTTANNKSDILKFNVDEWKEFYISRTPTQSGLFDIENCKCGSAGNLDDGNDINYIGAKKNDNGVMRKVAREESLVSKGNGIMFICDGEGSVGYTNYMDEDFIGSTTTSIGYDKALNPYVALFLVSILDKEKFKYSYGRKYRAHINEVMIRLPIQKNIEGLPIIDNSKKYSKEGYLPDWTFMENYIKALPYGDRI